MANSIGEKIVDATKIFGVCVVLPTIVVGGAIIGVGFVKLDAIEGLYEQDMGMYENELAFENGLTELTKKNTQINFETLNITNVEVVEINGNHYLSLIGKATINKEAGEEDINIVLDCNDYYWSILEKDLNNMNTASKVEWYQEYLGKTLPEDSIMNVYQKDLIATLADLIKDSQTRIISIQNKSENQTLFGVTIETTSVEDDSDPSASPQ